MAEFKLIEYSPDYFDKWNAFIEESNNGTIFHRLDFLSYHENKFQNYEKHLLIFKGNTLFALIPIAIFEENNKKIAKTPYGASFGGIVYKGILSYTESSSIIKLLLQHLKDNKIEQLIYTPPIEIYSKNYCATFTFTLLEYGFRIVNSDICHIVQLNHNDIFNGVISSKTRNIIRKAGKFEINISENNNLKDFYLLLSSTYIKFGTNPTHSFEELSFLLKKLPDKIFIRVAYIKDIPVSGILCLKVNSIGLLAFYLCSNEEFKHTQALSFLISDTMIKSTEDGFLYFDFGTSSYQMKARENLFLFKEGFGAVGRFRNTLSIQL